VFVADDHARAGPSSGFGEGGGAYTRRHDVRTDVAQRRDPPLLDGRQQAAVPAARRLVEEDALNGLRGTEVERLLQRRFLEVSDP
jgi:hypothetical protein